MSESSACPVFFAGKAALAPAADDVYRKGTYAGSESLLTEENDAMPVLILLILVLLPVPAQAWMGIVTQIQTGDTLLIQQVGGAHVTVVRLYGIDAPTLRQPYGVQAKDYLEKLLPVSVHVNVDPTSDADEKGVVTALVQSGSMSVNYQMVAEGLSWVQRNECKALFCRRWFIQERYAMRDKKGIWSTTHKTPPWQWAR